jgi:hypothetical protein
LVSDHYVRPRRGRQLACLFAAPAAQISLSFRR